MQFLVLLMSSLSMGWSLRPTDNLFWQYANNTARMYTNKSCYVCQNVMSSVVSVSMSVLSQDHMNTSCVKRYVWPGGNDKVWRRDVPDGCGEWRVNTSKPARPFLHEHIRIHPVFPPKFNFSACYRGKSLNESDPHGKVTKGQCLQVVERNTTTIRVVWDTAHVSDLKDFWTTRVRPGSGLVASTFSLDIDWWWYCGPKALFKDIPGDWSGLCAPIQLSYPVQIFQRINQHRPTRHKRDVSMDEVPTEHRLTTHWTRWWTSVFSQFGTVSQWTHIEVLHYRLAKFVNDTTEGMDGVRKELGALRLMTMQNRLALDMLLADKGGVCAMVGDQCCTFVPAEDEAEGAVGHAVEEMKKTAHKLYEDETKDKDWGWGFMHNLFGWVTPLITMLIPVCLILLAICVFGPCLMQCLMNRMYGMIDAVTRDRRYTPVANG